MKPNELGKKYDKIAQWWHDQHHDSKYGLAQLEKALNFSVNGGSALDVGCGVGGRLIRKIQASGFSVTGIDVSAEMIRLARRNHSEVSFYVRDICTWDTENKFDLIIAWDSIFHLPLQMQHPVIDKLCNLLAENGVLIYTFGNAVGEHTDTWHDDRFYYSSIGINANLISLIRNGLSIVHLELDQFPQNHVYVIATKPGGDAT